MGDRRKNNQKKKETGIKLPNKYTIYSSILPLNE